MIYSILLLILFIHLSDELQCNVVNTIQGISTMSCPSNVNQCMKFTCDLNGMDNVYKGCNDLNNPPISCLQLMNNCMSMNGKGKCSTCYGDYCNSSMYSSILSILLIPLLLLLF